ncbi:HAD family acid phosphatase [Allokutzneria sp. NRRL B-24872]|uniref:HAD family acid phosphatase n=1 Tax=Allokutzneria sp. NRRL B-24872 TaxID=1137961 RepID=UPI000A3A4CC8|nr:HAD family acid phosphatase [Allokutzneria sp. NRRL B-24872]
MVSRTAALVIAAGLLVGTVALSTSDGADAAGKPKEPANIGQVKNDVKQYYGDYLDPAGKHHASATSAWANQTASEINSARRWLERRLAEGVKNPAIVLDIDDTSELTYGFEAERDFGFDQAAFDKAINAGEFPAIEPTRELTQWASKRGVHVYFLTGRKENVREGTVNSLRKNGFPEPKALFLKPLDKPLPWLACGLSCNTVQYKSGTRAHLESQGETVLLSVGDQYSDLEGGHAERTVKLPNPMYHLP